MIAPVSVAINVQFVSQDYMETDSFPTRSKDAKSRRKRQAPYMIFPEILCIVDYDGYRWVEEIKTYFWLARVCHEVKVRIKIYGGCSSPAQH